MHPYDGGDRKGGGPSAGRQESDRGGHDRGADDGGKEPRHDADASGHEKANCNGDSSPDDDDNDDSPSRGRDDGGGGGDLAPPSPPTSSHPRDGSSNPGPDSDRSASSGRRGPATATTTTATATRPGAVYVGGDGMAPPPARLRRHDAAGGAALLPPGAAGGGGYDDPTTSVSGAQRLEVVDGEEQQQQRAAPIEQLLHRTPSAAAAAAGMPETNLRRSATELTAEPINEESMREEIREEILAGAAVAQAVTVVSSRVIDVEGDDQQEGVRDSSFGGDEPAEAAQGVGKEGGSCSDASESTMCGGSRRMAWLVASCLLLAAVAIGVGLGVGLPPSGEEKAGGESSEVIDAGGEEDAPQISTLERVLQRGFLKCSVNDDLAGFSFKNIFSGVEREGTGNAEGFYIDLCRAMAAAVFGDPSKAELVYSTRETRYQFIADRKADLSMRGDTHTFERDVFQSDTGVGFTFSTPFLYDGMTFAGVPAYVHCAENRDTSGPCSDLKVCVASKTTWRDLLRGMLPGSNLYETATVGVYIQHMIDGDCNVVAGETPHISSAVARLRGYEGPYAIGTGPHSKEPLAVVTRDGDPVWSDFVDAVLQALLRAERDGIDQDAAGAFPQTRRFGERHRDMFRHALAAGGNYGEIYERNLEAIIPRNGINNLNDGTTGLIYSHPLGKVHVNGPGPTEGGALERILVRGRLLCGIAASDVSQAITDAEEGGGAPRVWIGIDADFCRATAAAIFEGAPDVLEFVEVSGAEEGFDALSNGRVDIFSGLRGNVEAEFGFSFSPPYYFGPVMSDESKEEIHALGVLEDDPQFAPFVYWVVAATIHAEESSITQDSSFDMPAINLFGPTYTRMFRDVILTVGNYEEIYNRNERAVAAMPPRGGRNLLNANPFGPQHHPYSFATMNIQNQQ